MGSPTSMPSTPDPLPVQPRLSASEIAALLSRGDASFAIGDVSSARAFYERAADAGEGRAALRLGHTFDPVFLDFAHLRMRGDAAMAESWYRRARELGETGAEVLLTDAHRRHQDGLTAAQPKTVPVERRGAAGHFKNVTTRRSALVSGSAVPDPSAAIQAEPK
jgi:TPR repeat protein